MRELDGDADTHLETDSVTVAVALLDGDRVYDGVTEPDTVAFKIVAVEDTDTLNERDPVMVTETERENVGEAEFDGDPEPLRVPLTDAVSEPPGPRDGD